MELLVYARNYRALSTGVEGPTRRELGALIGEAAPPLCIQQWLFSYVEVRLPCSVVDPCTEIELLIAKAFASSGHPGGGRVLRYRTSRGRVKMLLEPGFERARDLCRALQPVLPQARALLERAASQADAAPEPVAPDDERTAPLRLTRPSYRFQAPPLRLR